MKFFNGRWVIGIAIILIGLALLSNNLGFYEFNISDIIKIIISIALIVWGIELILKKNDLGGTIFGIIILLFGLNMFFKRMGWQSLDMSFIWSLFWPIVLIFIGLKMVFRFKGSEKIAFWSGIEIGSSRWSLENKSYTAFMGGIDIDLTSAEIPDGDTEINMTAVMGGIDVIVPDNVNVVCKGSFVFGGIEFIDKSSGGIISTVHEERQVNSNKTIIFNCDVVFGGIEVKIKNSYNKTS